MAAFQRSKTYLNAAERNDTFESRKSEFRKELERRLAELAKKYTEPVADSEHVASIENLATELSTEYRDVLYKGRFRIGSAQKVLNTYLKYLWCTGKIPTPPHCPFDSVIISKLDGCEHIKWTRLDRISEYRQLVSAAREKAGVKTIAQWELKTFNNSSQSQGLLGLPNPPCQKGKACFVDTE